MSIANVLDPIHSELSPHVWDDAASTHPVLKPQHRKWIKATIYAALSKAGYTDIEKWLHLVLTGSLTTYQYSEASDCDVSLFVDVKLLPEWSRGEMIGIMVGRVDGSTLPGTPFVMQDFVVPSGIKPDDLYKPGLRSGYDLDTEKWLVPPERDHVRDVEKEENGFYVFALQMADKMESLLKYEPDKAIAFWHQIHRRRQQDQKRGKGDFAESNIVYKFLANRGLFPKISEVSGEYIAKTAAWSDHFVNQIKPIADAYERLPMYDPEAAPAWQELADDSMRRAQEIGKRLNVQVTDHPEPYASHQEMFDDINRGNFQVSRANSEHPIWTPEQNVAFRTVHDVEGHYPTGGDFGWEGENKACGAHFPTLSPNAQRALMTECLGQTGYAIDRGGFGPQKVGFMDEHLLPAQQAYNQPVTPHGTFSHVIPPRGFCHRHIRHGIYRLAAPTVLSATAPEVAKFVYHPLHNRLFLGEMGKEEGQMPSHYQLATMSGWDPKELTYGQVGKNGYGETFGRPRIKGFGAGGMNQYEQDYRTQEALRRVLPGTKFIRGQDLLNSEWELPGDPEVQYAGQPPMVEADPNTPAPAQWEF